MSVRTAWEIAALEDVRLAPSPRQQQPAPAPCVRPASASPLLGPAEDPGAADREVLPRGWGRFPSALGCSVAYRPSPRPLRDIGGQEHGSLSSLPVPTPGPGESQAGAGAFTPQPGAAPSASAVGSWGDPFLPLGLETLHQGPGCPRAPQEGGSTAGGSDHTAPRPGVKPVQLAQRPACGERAGPPRVTDLRKAGHGGGGLAPLLWPHRQGLAPVTSSSGSLSHPPSPPMPR